MTGGWGGGGGGGGEGLTEQEVLALISANSITETTGRDIARATSGWINLDDFVDDPDDAADDFDAAIAACIANDKSLLVPGKSYTFDRVAAPIDAFVEIRGMHLSKSVLLYDPASPTANGFIRYTAENGLGFAMRNLSILTADDSETPVHAIWLQPGSWASGHIHLEDLNISYRNSDSERWENGINAIGTVNPNPPAGLRSMFVKNVIVHDNCDTFNVNLFGVKGATFLGGQYFGDFNISSDAVTISENIWILSEIQGTFTNAGGSQTSNIHRITA